MKYRYFLSFFIIFALISNSAFAQLVGDNAFLQGQWLEAAIAPNGSWGNTLPVPGAYTTRAGSALYYPDPVTGVDPAGNGLDFSYDQGHDGWTIGTPPWYGAYYLPGTPFDGWSIQIDDTMSSAFYSNNDEGHPAFDTTEFTPGPYFRGTVTGYSGPSCWSPNAAATGTWQGSYGLRRAGLQNALQITQVNEVDPLASWLIVTTKFYNTTDSVLKGVYYFATADPDNDVTVGGTYPTNNHIAYQGGLYDRHEVWARPPSIHQDGFSGLATHDCRSKVLIYQSWPPTMTTDNNLDLVWNATETGMGATYYALGATTLDQDIAYGLIFNIGNIAPNDSAFVSYAWIFSDTNAVDSIFTKVPELSTLGIIHTTSQPDSIFGCNLTGCGVIGDSLFTADIINGQNRDWSFSKWTWTPAIGLSTTTGRHVIVDLSLLTGPVTYTITGTPDVTRGSCTPPAPVTFTMYVQPCFSASCNIPCINDTLKLTGTGDTAGATFIWAGPLGYTSTGQSTYRFPLTMTDTGKYRLIKIVGTDQDTVYTDAHQIIPLPVDKFAGDSIICSGNPLFIMTTPDSLGDTFMWSGPNAFTATTQNLTILNAPHIDSGLYTLITISKYGCRDTIKLNVVIDSTPAVPRLDSNSPICSQQDTLFLTGTDTTSGIKKYYWTGPLSFTSSLQNPILTGLTTGASGTYTDTVAIVYSLYALRCTNFNTITVVVDSTPYLPVLTSNSPVCTGNPLNLTATTTTGANYFWTGPNSFSSTVQNPTINPATTAATGIYSLTATLVYTLPALTCRDSNTMSVVVDSTPLPPSASSNSPGFPGVSVCQADTLKLYSSDSTAGVVYIWKGPDAFLSTIQDPTIPGVTPAATGTYTVTAELVYTAPPLTCTDSATTYVSITPTPPLTATSNSPVCSGDTLVLQANSDPGAAYNWTGPYTFFSSLQGPTRIPAITEYAGIYQVFAIVKGCPSATIFDTVIVHQTPLAPWVAWLTYCQFYPPSPLQAFGDSITWYTTAVVSGAGSHTPPIPSTDNVGETYYYATQTVQACTSPVDSILVSVYPKPVITVSASVGVCPHDSAIITVTDTDPLAYYKWYPSLYLNNTSSAVVITRPENNVSYMVVASNQYGCADTANVLVTVKAGAVLTIPDSATLHPGETFQITPQTNCNYFTWFPSAGLDNAYISNPVASPLVSTRYFVTGVTEWGCIVTDSINIYVDEQTLLAVPNAFTPGNGPNSIFKIIKQGIATLNSFNIYNRWGNLVFSTTDIDEGWDGTYKGVAQPFGVYVYEIDAVTSAGQPYIKKGNVTLVR